MTDSGACHDLIQQRLASVGADVDLHNGKVTDKDSRSGSTVCLHYLTDLSTINVILWLYLAFKKNSTRVA